MSKTPITLCVGLILFTLACQPLHPPPCAGEGNLLHVVIIRLNNPGDPEAQRKIIAASESFRQIPGVQTVHVGKVLSGNRPHQDSNFDVGLVMGFKSKEDMDAYIAHPIHVKAVNEVLKPLAEDYTSYDFTNEP